jgi:hypothetical protein
MSSLLAHSGHRLGRCTCLRSGAIRILVIIRNDPHDENGDGVAISELPPLPLDFFAFFTAFFAAFFSAFAAIFSSFFLSIDRSRSGVTGSFNDLRSVAFVQLDDVQQPQNQDKA